MPVLESVQDRKLTSNDKSQKLPAFSYGISPVFYTLFRQTSILWRCISAKIQCSIFHGTLYNLCVCHLSLHSRFNFLQSTLIFNFDLCNIQIFAFDIQLFHKKQSSFEFDLQVQWNVHSFFRIQHLAFVLSEFSLPTSDFGHCTCKFPHSTIKFSN